MRFGKRGVSQIIATVLIILVTVAAISLIAGFIIPFVRDNLGEGTECLNFQENYKFKEKIDSGDAEYFYNCAKTISGGEQYGFSIEAEALEDKNLEELKGFNVVFYTGEGVSERVDLFDGVDLADVKVYNSTLDVFANQLIVIPKKGEVRTYVYESDKTFEKIEIYSVLQNGRVCAKSDEINIINCGGNINFD
tara:strand:+ start:219 stop:797 length:579 start_codon:yes stop_codon:yes gene_type:complete